MAVPSAVRPPRRRQYGQAAGHEMRLACRLAYWVLSTCVGSHRSGKGRRALWIMTGRRDTPRGERQEQI